MSLLSMTCIAVVVDMTSQVVCGTMGMPTATVQLKGPDGISRIGVGVGTGECFGCCDRGTATCVPHACAGAVDGSRHGLLSCHAS
jgi:hypothetical protein